MNKPQNLKKGDKVAIISLSNGMLGEDFCKHELDIAVKRLQEYGLEPVIMPNALKGIEYLKNNPQKRAEDLKTAFADDSIKGIICAIGGDDTYKTYPYLMEDDEFIENVKKNPKIFTGFSDTTMNHLMFYKLGLTTFYGPTIVCDFAELDNEMIPYTKQYIDLFFNCPDEFEIKSSDTWYKDRESYGVEQIGTPRKSIKESHGFEVLNGNGTVTGALLGGCIESIYEALTSSRYDDEYSVCSKYDILPTAKDWENKVMFIETSELKASPESLETMLTKFKELGYFNKIKGIIVGKPIDEVFYDEYKEVYKKLFGNTDIPILYNVNFGHATPRCIIPYGVTAEINTNLKTLKIIEKPFA